MQISQHHWPVWGNALVVEHLSLQRDMYRYINDETLRLANHGHTMVEIAEKVEVPNAIGSKFSNRGYYGTFNHNVKATYVLYLGWFHGNPATLHELPSTEASKRYVERGFRRRHRFGLNAPQSRRRDAEPPTLDNRRATRPKAPGSPQVPIWAAIREVDEVHVGCHLVSIGVCPSPPAAS